MSYPGDSGLDAKIQQRILSAFAEAVRLYQEGNPEECRTVLRSILEVDPSFSPASRLMSAVDAGAPVDLAKLLGDIGAAGGVDLDSTLTRARQAFSARDFASTATLAREVLRELPGHDEARELLRTAESRLSSAGEVAARLRQAREALARGAENEATRLLELARSLDPSHPDIPGIESAIGSHHAVGLPVEFEFVPAPATEAGLDGSTVTTRPPTLPPQPSPEPRTRSSAPVEPPAAPSAAAVEPPRPVVPAAAPIFAGQAPAAQPQPAPPVPPAPAAPGEAEFVFGGSPAPAQEADGDLFSVDDTPAGRGEPAPAVAAGLVPPLVPTPSPAAPEAEAPAPAAEGGKGGTAARVEELLAQGREEFDRGDFQAAIETWSRIYLIQTNCPDADRNIEEARRRREELERQVDHHFYEAREAFEHGHIDEARALCQEVLKLQPQHLEAHDLLARLETPAAPPPPPVGTHGDEEDLFRDDFVPAPPSPAGAAAVPAPREGSAAPVSRRPSRETTRRRFVIPTPLAVLLGALVVVLVIVAVLLRSTLFGGKADVVSSTIAQAEEAATHGRIQDAINLLKSLQATEQLDGSVANQVNQRIVNYQRAMKSQSVRTPDVAREPIRAALAAGKRLKALRLVREALVRVPGDTELIQLQNEILAYSSSLATLLDAVNSHDMERVRRSAQTLLDQHPDDAEARSVYDAATFDQALVMLRKYQVGTAKALLDELARRGGDAEVDRVREFASRYISRPVDPRYQIFVTNVDLRPLE